MYMHHGAKAKHNVVAPECTNKLQVVLNLVSAKNLSSRAQTPSPTARTHCRSAGPGPGELGMVVRRQASLGTKGSFIEPQNKFLFRRFGHD